MSFTSKARKVSVSLLETMSQAFSRLPTELSEFMESAQMRALCRVKGSAMLTVGNCMNHSCDPNVISSSSHNDHRVTFTAVKEIRAGDQLTISYIDEHLPLEKRQELLRKFYGFNCRCDFCIAQQKGKRVL